MSSTMTKRDLLLFFLGVCVIFFSCSANAAPVKGASRQRGRALTPLGPDDERIFYELSITAKGKKNQPCPAQVLSDVVTDVLVPAIEDFDPVGDLVLTNSTVASIVSDNITFVNETVNNSTETRMRGRRRLYGWWGYKGGMTCECCYCNPCDNDADFWSRNLQATEAPSLAPSVFPSATMVPSAAPSLPEAKIRLRSDTVPRKAMKKLRKKLFKYIDLQADDFCMRGTIHILKMEYVDPPPGEDGLGLDDLPPLPDDDDPTAPPPPPPP